MTRDGGNGDKEEVFEVVDDGLRKLRWKMCVEKTLSNCRMITSSRFTSCRPADSWLQICRMRFTSFSLVTSFFWRAEGGEGGGSGGEDGGEGDWEGDWVGSEEGDDGDEGDEVAILFFGLPPPSSSAEDFVLFIHKNGVFAGVIYALLLRVFYTHRPPVKPGSSSSSSWQWCNGKSDNRCSRRAASKQKQKWGNQIAPGFILTNKKWWKTCKRYNLGVGSRSVCVCVLAGS